MSNEQQPEVVREVEVIDAAERKEPFRAKPEYTIVLTVEGSRLDAVTKRAKLAFGLDLVSIEKINHATSRNAQFADAIEQIEEVKQDIEGLRDEMQEAIDNTPESLQNSEKYSERQQCVEELEQFIDELENLCQTSIDFPGMY